MKKYFFGRHAARKNCEWRSDFTKPVGAREKIGGETVCGWPNKEMIVIYMNFATKNLGAQDNDNFLSRFDNYFL